MSKIINCGLEQYGTKPFEQQQFGKGGIKGVKHTQTEKYPQTDTNTHIQTDKHAQTHKAVTKGDALSDRQSCWAQTERMNA